LALQPVPVQGTARLDVHLVVFNLEHMIAP
jgi:hypothetical protein